MLVLVSFSFYFMINVGKIWLDGKITTIEDSKVSILTHTIHYGTSIFEGCRAYNGKVFKMKEHNARFIRSGEICDIPVPYSMEELENAINQVLEVNNYKDAYVRPVAWMDDAFLSVNTMKNKVHVAIMAWEWPSYYGEEKIKKGITLGKSRWVRPDPRSVPIEAKAGGYYYVGTMIYNNAEREGFDDILLVDWRGFVAECSSSNVFFIEKDGTICTPIADAFLNGITRQSVIEMLKNAGYKVEERRVLPQEIPSFKEAFVTGTAAEITPIGEIWGVKYIPDECLKIREMYSKLVRQ